MKNINKINLKTEKVNYVAIGDSISESYNSYFNFAYAGRQEENGNISGLSWPAFLSRYIQTINKDALGSYKNFSITGSRADDWNYFLGCKNKKYSFENSKNKINFAKKLSKEVKNPHKDLLKKNFKEFGKKNPKDFDYFRKSIQEANLITFNIGANSTIPELPIEKILKWNLKNDIEKAQIEANKLVNGIKNDIVVMIRKIKELSPKANIVIVGYVLPFNPLFNFINNKLDNLKHLHHNGVLNYYVNLTNELLKNIAKEEEVHWVSIDNEEFWRANNSKLSPIFYEIHPTTKGYKKIAQDVLTKIALSNKFWTQSFSSINEELKTWNNQYFKKDKKCFANIIDFSSIDIPDNKIIDTIYGSDKELWKISKEEEKEDKLKSEIVPEQFFTPPGELGEVLINNTPRSLSVIFDALSKNFLSDLKDFFKDESNKKNMLTFIKKSEFLLIISNYVQQELEIRYKKNIEVNDEEFSKIILSALLDPSVFIQYIKNTIEFIVDSGKKFINQVKKIIINFSIEIINHERYRDVLLNFLKKILNFILLNKNITVSDANINIILDHFVKAKKVPAFLDEVITIGLDNIEKLRKFKTTNDWLNFFINQDYKSINIQDQLLEMVSTKKIRDVITQEFIQLIKPEGNEDENKKQVDYLLKNSFVFIEENEILNELLHSISSNIIFNPKEELSFSNLMDSVFGFDKKHFWYKLAKIKEGQNSKEFFTITSQWVDFICSKSKKSGMFYTGLKQIKHSNVIINDKSNKANQLLIIKQLDTIKQINLSLKVFFGLLYKEYSKTRTQLIDKENLFYKTIFRTTIICFLVAYKSLQEGLPLNIFWNDKKGLNTFSVVNILSKSIIGDNKDNKEEMEFFDHLFGQKNSKELSLKVNENSYTEEQWLWYIFSMDKNPVDKYTQKNKMDIILDAVKRGYW